MELVTQLSFTSTGEKRQNITPADRAATPTTEFGAHAYVVGRRGMFLCLKDTAVQADPHQDFPKIKQLLGLSRSTLIPSD
jgi:hypothetical protein